MPVTGAGSVTAPVIVASHAGHLWGKRLSEDERERSKGGCDRYRGALPGAALVKNRRDY